MKKQMKKMLNGLLCGLLCISLVIPLHLEAQVISDTQMQNESASKSLEDQGEYKRFLIKYNDTVAVEWLNDETIVASFTELPSENGTLILIQTVERMTVSSLEEAGWTGDDIEYIMPDYPLKLAAIEEPLLEENEWLLPDEASAFSAGSEGSEQPATSSDDIMIALLDTGVDITHEALADAVVSGWNFITDTPAVHSDETIYDEWHGTHLAGIIAARENGEHPAGIAPEAKVMPLVVFQNSLGYTSDAIRAIDYAATHGAKIVNCSFTAGEQENPALADAMDRDDMLFVCAAGNEGKNLDETPVFPAAYSNDHIVTVGASDSRGNLAGYSNKGAYVDITAMGQKVMSTMPGNRYAPSSGTSMAAAYISGVAASLLTKNIELTPVQLKEMLLSVTPATSQANKVLPTALGLLDPQSEFNLTQGQEVVQLEYIENIELNDTYVENSVKVWAAGTIYATGGEIEALNESDSITKYDDRYHAWVPAGTLLTPRYGHTSVAQGNKIYTMQGYFSGNGIEPGALCTLEVYDTQTEISVQKMSSPLQAWDTFSSYATENTVFLKSQSYGLYAYDITNDVWNAITDINGTLFSNGQSLYACKDGDIYRYDEDADEWTNIYGESFNPNAIFFMVGQLVCAYDVDSLTTIDLNSGHRSTNVITLPNSVPVVGGDNTVYFCSEGTTIGILHLTQSAPDYTWSFYINGDLKGWKPQRDLTNVQVVNDVLSAKSVGGDPIFENNTINLVADNIKYIHVRIKNLTPGNVIRFYWRNTEMTGHTNEASVMFENMKANSNEFQEFYFDMSQNQYWTGTIDNLRFDPTNKAGDIEIDFIDLIETDSQKQKEYEAYQQLNIMYGDGDTAQSVTQNLNLPNFINEVAVIWKSSDKSVITDEGMVTRPSVGSEAASITLEARIGSKPFIKHFQVIVVPKIGVESYIWSFMDEDEQEWFAVRDIRDFQFKGGKMMGTSTGFDPIIQNRSDRVYDADVINTLKITINVGEAEYTDVLQLFWQYPGDSTHSSDKCITIPINGAQSDYTVDLSSIGTWCGEVTKLRLDPLKKKGKDFSITYLSLYNQNEIEQDIYTFKHKSGGIVDNSSAPGLREFVPVITGDHIFKTEDGEPHKLTVYASDGERLATGKGSVTAYLEAGTEALISVESQNKCRIIAVYQYAIEKDGGKWHIINGKLFKNNALVLNETVWYLGQWKNGIVCTYQKNGLPYARYYTQDSFEEIQIPHFVSIVSDPFSDALYYSKQGKNGIFKRTITGTETKLSNDRAAWIYISANKLYYECVGGLGSTKTLNIR